MVTDHITESLYPVINLRLQKVDGYDRCHWHLGAIRCQGWLLPGDRVPLNGGKIWGKHHGNCSETEEKP